MSPKVPEKRIPWRIIRTALPRRASRETRIGTNATQISQETFQGASPRAINTPPRTLNKSCQSQTNLMKPPFGGAQSKIAKSIGPPAGRSQGGIVEEAKARKTLKSAL